ncbi:hypothetical protein BKA64DRAFT_694055 [Cadophora sp. MPI-SDFR-AT-0126]|nr:hypothetical protein BKA64DRAFT_694055 [Leotiomycetes sp. MPI-SDFR-AT-0126]
MTPAFTSCIAATFLSQSGHRLDATTGNCPSSESSAMSFSKGRRANKSKSLFRGYTVLKDRRDTLTSSIITLVVGRERRLFAAHEDALSTSKRISLRDEEPEIFSSVLEYLYKGDYYPRLVHNKGRNSWEIDTGTEGSVEPTVYHHGIDGELLKDTVIYCAAEKYGLDELKRVALQKQGLQSGIQCSTVLSSARYAYANTPDTDSNIRAHYLALIIRSRGTFKQSGTMQLEMQNGGSRLFFDLFVALCNHVDDVIIATEYSSSLIARLSS